MRHRNTEALGRGDEPFIVAGEQHVLVLVLEKSILKKSILMPDPDLRSGRSGDLAPDLAIPNSARRLALALGCARRHLRKGYPP